jgi:hypothetical protein
MKLKIPPELTMAGKLIVAAGMLYALAAVMLSNNDAAERTARLKKVEKDFRRLSPESVVGTWAQENAFDRTKFLYITRKTDHLFNVKYVVGSDTSFKAVFVLSEHELNGDVPGIFGSVNRKIIFDGNQEALFNLLVFRRIN